MNLPQIMSPAEWEAARAALLVKEKEATRARDALAAERRRLPMVRVEKEYVFEGPDGEASLLDLFDGRRQLIAVMNGPMSVYVKSSEKKHRRCVKPSWTALPLALTP